MHVHTCDKHQLDSHDLTMHATDCCSVLCVCVCVCVPSYEQDLTRLRACACTCFTCAHTSAHIHAHLHAHMHAYAHIHAHIHAHTRADPNPIPSSHSFRSRKWRFVLEDLHIGGRGLAGEEAHVANEVSIRCIGCARVRACVCKTALARGY